MKIVSKLLLAVALAAASASALSAELTLYTSRKQPMIQPVLDAYTKTTGTTFKIVADGEEPVVERGAKVALSAVVAGRREVESVRGTTALFRRSAVSRFRLFRIQSAAQGRDKNSRSYYVFSHKVPFLRFASGFQAARHVGKLSGAARAESLPEREIPSMN